MPGSDLQRTLSRLVYRQNNEGRRFDPEHKRGVPPAAGVGTADGAGIASPLTEDDAATRQYHDTETLTTTDGLFTLTVDVVQQIDMVDANGREVILVFDNPFHPSSES